MKPAQAKAVLELLLNGVDPVTGECLSDDHVCAQPLVIRALHSAISALDEAGAVPAAAGNRTGRKERLPANRPWTREEDERLRQMHAAGCSVEEICGELQRRPRGLANRMASLGLIESDDRPRISGIERAGTPWYPEDDERLRELFAHGTAAGDIAAEMRRSKYSIACRLEKLGLISDREQLRD